MMYESKECQHMHNPAGETS